MPKEETQAFLPLAFLMEEEQSKIKMSQGESMKSAINCELE